MPTQGSGGSKVLSGILDKWGCRTYRAVNSAGTSKTGFKSKIEAWKFLKSIGEASEQQMIAAEKEHEMLVKKVTALGNPEKEEVPAVGRSESDDIKGPEVPDNPIKMEKEMEEEEPEVEVLMDIDDACEFFEADDTAEKAAEKYPTLKASAVDPDAWPTFNEEDIIAFDWEFWESGGFPDFIRRPWTVWEEHYHEMSMYITNLQPGYAHEEFWRTRATEYENNGDIGSFLLLPSAVQVQFNVVSMIELCAYLRWQQQDTAPIGDLNAFLQQSTMFLDGGDNPLYPEGAFKSTMRDLYPTLWPHVSKMPDKPSIGSMQGVLREWPTNQNSITYAATSGVGGSDGCFMHTANLLNKHLQEPWVARHITSKRDIIDSCLELGTPMIQIYAGFKKKILGDTMPWTSMSEFKLVFPTISDECERMMLKPIWDLSKLEVPVLYFCGTLNDFWMHVRANLKVMANVPNGKVAWQVLATGPGKFFAVIIDLNDAATDFENYFRLCIRITIWDPHAFRLNTCIVLSGSVDDLDSLLVYFYKPRPDFADQPAYSPDMQVFAHCFADFNQEKVATKKQQEEPAMSEDFADGPADIEVDMAAVAGEEASEVACLESDANPTGEIASSYVAGGDTTTAIAPYQETVMKSPAKREAQQFVAALADVSPEQLRWAEEHYHVHVWECRKIHKSVFSICDGYTGVLISLVKQVPPSCKFCKLMYDSAVERKKSESIATKSELSLPMKREEPGKKEGPSEGDTAAGCLAIVPFQPSKRKATLMSAVEWAGLNEEHKLTQADRSEHPKFHNPWHCGLCDKVIEGGQAGSAKYIVQHTTGKAHKNKLYAALLTPQSVECHGYSMKLDKVGECLAGKYSSSYMQAVRFTAMFTMECTPSITADEDLLIKSAKCKGTRPEGKPGCSKCIEAADVAADAESFCRLKLTQAIQTLLYSHIAEPEGVDPTLEMVKSMDFMLHFKIRKEALGTIYKKPKDLAAILTGKLRRNTVIFHSPEHWQRFKASAKDTVDMFKSWELDNKSVEWCGKYAEHKVQGKPLDIGREISSGCLVGQPNLEFIANSLVQKAMKPEGTMMRGANQRGSQEQRENYLIQAANLRRMKKFDLLQLIGVAPRDPPVKGPKDKVPIEKDPSFNPHLRENNDRPVYQPPAKVAHLPVPFCAFLVDRLQPNILKVHGRFRAASDKAPFPYHFSLDETPAWRKYEAYQLQPGGRIVAIGGIGSIDPDADMSVLWLNEAKDLEATAPLILCMVMKRVDYEGQVSIMNFPIGYGGQKKTVILEIFRVTLESCCMSPEPVVPASFSMDCTPVFHAVDDVLLAQAPLPDDHEFWRSHCMQLPPPSATWPYGAFAVRSDVDSCWSVVLGAVDSEHETKCAVWVPHSDARTVHMGDSPVDWTGYMEDGLPPAYAKGKDRQDAKEVLTKLLFATPPKDGTPVPFHKIGGIIWNYLVSLQSISWLSKNFPLFQRELAMKIVHFFLKMNRGYHLSKFQSRAKVNEHTLSAATFRSMQSNTGHMANFSLYWHRRSDGREPSTARGHPDYPCQPRQHLERTCEFFFSRGRAKTPSGMLSHLDFERICASLADETFSKFDREYCEPEDTDDAKRELTIENFNHSTEWAKKIASHLMVKLCANMSFAKANKCLDIERANEITADEIQAEVLETDENTPDLEDEGDAPAPSLIEVSDTPASAAAPRDERGELIPDLSDKDTLMHHEFIQNLLAENVDRPEANQHGASSSDAVGSQQASEPASGVAAASDPSAIPLLAKGSVATNRCVLAFQKSLVSIVKSKNVQELMIDLVGFSEACREEEGILKNPGGVLGNLKNTGHKYNIAENQLALQRQDAVSRNLPNCSRAYRWHSSVRRLMERCAVNFGDGSNTLSIIWVPENFYPCSRHPAFLEVHPPPSPTSSFQLLLIIGSDGRLRPAVVLTVWRGTLKRGRATKRPAVAPVPWACGVTLRVVPLKVELIGLLTAQVHEFGIIIDTTQVACEFHCTRTEYRSNGNVNFYLSEATAERLQQAFLSPRAFMGSLHVSEDGVVDTVDAASASSHGGDDPDEHLHFTDDMFTKRPTGRHAISQAMVRIAKQHNLLDASGHLVLKGKTLAVKGVAARLDDIAKRAPQLFEMKYLKLTGKVYSSQVFADLKKACLDVMDFIKLCREVLNSTDAIEAPLSLPLGPAAGPAPAAPGAP